MISSRKLKLGVSQDKAFEIYRYFEVDASNLIIEFRNILLEASHKSYKNTKEYIVIEKERFDEIFNKYKKLFEGFKFKKEVTGNSSHE
jgi:hypothetical protein